MIRALGSSASGFSRQAVDGRIEIRVGAPTVEQIDQVLAQAQKDGATLVEKFQREFEATKAKVAIGRSLESLAGMMKSSITELQGMMGGEMSQSMQQLRQSAAAGEMAQGWTARFGLLNLAMVKSFGLEGKVYAGIFAIPSGTSTKCCIPD